MWQIGGMHFHLTYVELQVLYWSGRDGVMLLHHLLVACAGTLEQLAIGSMKEKSEDRKDTDTMLITVRRMGLCG